MCAGALCSFSDNMGMAMVSSRPIQKVIKVEPKEKVINLESKVSNDKTFKKS